MLQNPYLKWNKNLRFRIVFTLLFLYLKSYFVYLYYQNVNYKPLQSINK